MLGNHESITLLLLQPAHFADGYLKRLLKGNTTVHTCGAYGRKNVQPADRHLSKARDRSIDVRP
jgi:hypothetical protein